MKPPLVQKRDPYQPDMHQAVALWRCFVYSPCLNLQASHIHRSSPGQMVFIRVAQSDMKYRDKRRPEPKRRSGVGPFACHHNGSISSFAPLWIAAPLIMNEGCRPASCQVVSTPFSATPWPTPRSLLGLHSLQTRFCNALKETLMVDDNTVDVLFQLQSEKINSYSNFAILFPNLKFHHATTSEL